MFYCFVVWQPIKKKTYQHFSFSKMIGENRCVNNNTRNAWCINSVGGAGCPKFSKCDFVCVPCLIYCFHSHRDGFEQIFGEQFEQISALDSRWLIGKCSLNGPVFYKFDEKQNSTILLINNQIFFQLHFVRRKRQVDKKRCSVSVVWESTNGETGPISLRKRCL